jgi:hypothetical protein
LEFFCVSGQPGFKEVIAMTFVYASQDALKEFFHDWN